MEIEFGKENLDTLPTAFVKKVEKQLRDIEGYLQSNLQESSRAELIERKARLQEAIRQ
jgi:hypothetical protein